MKKKILSLLTMLCMAVSLLPANIITVSAYNGTKYGSYLYYRVEDNGEVTITDCNEAATVVEIPTEIDSKKVTSIGGYAFSDCSSLASITIPDGVTSIGDRAFYNCSGLASITIPDGVTSIGDRAFYNCSSLASITIPDGVTSIGGYAFYNCSSLKKVNISDIDAWCNIEFANSDSNPLCYAKKLYIDNKVLTKAVLSDKVTKLGDCVFINCSSLASITIPDSVTSIGGYAFYNCSSLTDITIPDSVTSIGEDAFYNCSRLTKVNISDIDAWCNIEFADYSSNPLWYAKKLYIDNKVLTKAVLSDKVTKLGDYVFSNCSSLTDITIPDSVTSIGEEAFYNCSSLESITIPDSVTSIGGYAFYCCNSLASVTIGSGITSIDESIFQSCYSLTTVVIPKTVTEINQNAFSGCNNLSLIFYTGSSEEWEEMYIASGNGTVSEATKIYNATKKTYKLETNCDTAISDITDYAIMTAPAVKNGEKTLQGWYDNKGLTGSPVTFPYYGNATTLYASWTDKTGFSFDDAFTAKANEEYSVTIAESGQMIYYEFVPRLTGEYRFYSTGNLDTYGYLYDSNQSRLASNDDGGESSNFKITYTLTAGETYYIAVKLYSGTGSFTLVTETDCIESTNTVCVTATTGEKIFITLPKYLPENASVILACYKNNALTEVMTAPNKNETLYFIAKKEFDSAKVMVWDNFSSMKPLCEAEIVK